MTPLRILITRAMPEAEAVAHQLIALGHRPLVAPLQEAESIDEPFPPHKPDRLIATSARAFRYGAPIPADWFTLPLHVVGQATADVARVMGFMQLHIAQGDATRLLADILAHAQPQEQLLYLAGEPRRPEIEAGLKAAGYALDILNRYRMIGAQSMPDSLRDALRTGACDAALHFSALSAAQTIRLVRKAGLLAKFAQLSHLCLSRAIADCVEAEMAPQKAHLLCASRPNLTSLLALLTSLKS